MQRSALGFKVFHCHYADDLYISYEYDFVHLIIAKRLLPNYTTFIKKIYLNSRNKKALKGTIYFVRKVF